MKTIEYKATIDVILKAEVEDEFLEELKSKDEIDQEIKESIDKYIDYDKETYEITLNSTLEIK